MEATGVEVSFRPSFSLPRRIQAGAVHAVVAGAVAVVAAILAALAVGASAVVARVVIIKRRYGRNYDFWLVVPLDTLRQLRTPIAKYQRFQTGRRIRSSVACQ